MAWKKRSKMDEKLIFISRYLEGASITSLCDEFKISRTTDHNVIKRYREIGSKALIEQKRTPC